MIVTINLPAISLRAHIRLQTVHAEASKTMPLSYTGLQNGALKALAVLPVRPRLKILSCGCGLFGDVILAMNAVQFASEQCLSGAIYWGGRSLYFDPQKGGNAHEYFFENGRFDFTQGRGAASYAFSYVPAADNFKAPKGERPREALKRLIDKYAAPRGEIWEEAHAFRRKRLNAPHVLGVHIRRTDAARGLEGRKSQPVENFVSAVQTWLNENREGVIFLATDAADVVESFSAHFGDRAVCQDVERSSGGISLHGHLDVGTGGSPYAKGREALIDALILSQCDFLIRSFSFLTAYSLCINPSLNFLDLDKKNLRVVRTRWLHE